MNKPCENLWAVPTRLMQKHFAKPIRSRKLPVNSPTLRGTMSHRTASRRPRQATGKLYLHWKSACKTSDRKTSGGIVLSWKSSSKQSFLRLGTISAQFHSSAVGTGFHLETFFGASGEDIGASLYLCRGLFLNEKKKGPHGI